MKIGKVYFAHGLKNLEMAAVGDTEGWKWRWSHGFTCCSRATCLS